MCVSVKQHQNTIPMDARENVFQKVIRFLSTKALINLWSFEHVFGRVENIAVTAFVTVYQVDSSFWHDSQNFVLTAGMTFSYRNKRLPQRKNKFYRISPFALKIMFRHEKMCFNDKLKYIFKINESNCTRKKPYLCFITISLTTLFSCLTRIFSLYLNSIYSVFYRINVH